MVYDLTEAPELLRRRFVPEFVEEMKRVGSTRAKVVAAVQNSLECTFGKEFSVEFVEENLGDTLDSIFGKEDS